MRIPVDDDVLPLQTPVMDYTGNLHHQLIDLMPLIADE
jgi:hypothetical protein